jgi:hypothetical protein
MADGMKVIEIQSDVSEQAFEGMKVLWSGGRYELYDLHNDGAETVNLLNDRMAEALLARAAALTRRLVAIRQQDALALGAPIPFGMDVEDRKKLKALGYVQ